MANTTRRRCRFYITGFGAGDSRSNIGCIQRLPPQIDFGRAFEDKSQLELMIKESGLDWTIARPVVLTGARALDDTEFFENPHNGGTGSFRAPMLQNSSFDKSETYVHEAPVLVK